MAYSRNPTWKDYPDTSTPITAAKLENIESGLVAAAQTADSAITQATNAANSAQNSANSAQQAAANATAPTDNAVATVVNNSGSQTQLALDGRYTLGTSGKDLLSLRRLADLGQAELRQSQASHRIDYEDAAVFDERWTGITNWSAASWQVSNGRLYAASGSTAGGGHAFQIPSSGRARIITALEVPSAVGTGGYAFVGVNQDAAGGVPGGGGTAGIGVNPATNRPVFWRGNSVGGTNATTDLSTTALAGGVYRVEVIVDELQVSFILSDVANTLEYRTTVPRSSFSAINNVAIWQSDSRFTGGIGFHPVGARLASATLTPRTISSGAQTTTWNENWANLSNWTGTAGAVSGGKLYASGTASPGLGRGLVSQQTKTVVTTTMDIPATATGRSGLVLVGFTATPGGTAPSGTNLIGIGYDPATGKAVLYRGSGIGGSGTTYLTASAIAAGTYNITATVDGTNVTLTFKSGDGTTVNQTQTVALSSLGATLAQVALWVSDSATTTGVDIGSLSIATTTNVTVGYEGAANTAVYTKPLSSSTSMARVALPANYDSRRPVPLVMSFHGHGRTAVGQTFDDTQTGPFYTQITSAGYIVASADAQGDAWGNSASVADYEALYRYVRDHYAISSVVLVGQSMGGAASLSTLGRRVIPNIVGWYGHAPVCDLRAMYDANYNGTFQSEIASAYGIAAGGSNFDTQTAGFNPIKRNGWEFRGVAMRASIVNDDTVVPPASHWNVLQPKVAPYAVEASTFTTATGGHIATAAFNVSDFLSFMSRVTVS